MDNSDKGITIKKSEDFSEWFSQVVQKAELADIRYGVQGFVVHMPWAVKIARKIYEYFEEAVENDGHEPMLLPTVIPEEHLHKEKDHAGFVPEVFWIDYAGSEKLERRLALRPTGETQIYPMYNLWIRSYQNLPFKRYQSRITVFRNEMTTRPFMRGREFMFFETHDVFEKHEDALAQIKNDMQIMEGVVHDKLLIPFIFLKRPTWDRFKGANDTYASDTMHPDGRRSQISSTHDLGTNFAKAFEVTFTDRNGEKQYGCQTCFGPGIWRIIAALISIHGDDKGLVLPFDLAPVQVVVVPIIFKESKEVIKYAKEVASMLKYRVVLDDSSKTSGEKFNIWELKGVPLRIEIGPREAKEKKITIARRTDRKKETVALKELNEKIKANAGMLDSQIKAKAEEYFKYNTKKAESYNELKKLLETHKGFIVAPFCSTEKNGASCAEKLKEETTTVVCGTKLNMTAPLGKKCIICNRAAKHIVYIAKTI